MSRPLLALAGLLAVLGIIFLAIGFSGGGGNLHFWLFGGALLSLIASIWIGASPP